jgi:hypothetical protein
MKAACLNLTVVDQESGHWLPLELKAETIDIMRTWMKVKGLL